MHSPHSLLQKIVTLCVLVVLIVITLQLVIGFLERSWPWLLGIALLIAAAVVGVYFFRRGRGW